MRVIVDNIMSTQTNDAIFNSSLNFLVTVAEDDSGHNYLKDTPNFSEGKAKLKHICAHNQSSTIITYLFKQPLITYWYIRQALK